MDARVQLRAAHDLLAAIGMDAFADRAGKELLATGERSRQRVAETATTSPGSRPRRSPGPLAARGQTRQR